MHSGACKNAPDFFIIQAKKRLKCSKETAIEERNGTYAKKRQLRKETVKDQRNGKMQPPPPPFLCTFILFLCSLIFLQRNDRGKFALCHIGQKQRSYGVFGKKKNATILYQSLRLDVAKDSIFDTMQPLCRGSFLCLGVAF